MNRQVEEISHVGVAKQNRGLRKLIQAAVRPSSIGLTANEIIAFSRAPFICCNKESCLKIDKTAGSPNKNASTDNGLKAYTNCY